MKTNAPQAVLDAVAILSKRRGGLSVYVVAVPALLIALTLVAPRTLYLFPWTLSLFLVAMAILLRAQENLLHELSHNHLGRSAAFNAAIGKAICIPLLQDFEHYRKTHNGHHARFGSGEDPCFKRMAYHGKVAAWRHLVEFYSSIGKVDAKTLALYLAWLALLTCLGGVVAVVLWLLAQFLALPLIRAEAEAAEHDYSLGSELQGTYTSLGERKLIHPVGDGYHLLHHMFPSVPGPELRALHDVAVAQWPEYGSKAALYKLGKKNAQPIVS